VVKGLYGNADVINQIAGINNIWDDDLQHRAEQINEGYSHVLLFLQDQIRIDNYFSGWDRVNQLIEKIRVPIVAFSMGANSFTGWDPQLHKKLSPGLIRFLQLVSERTAVLGVRGEFTADVLTKLRISNHEVTGCPSYFEGGRGRRVRKAEFRPEADVLATGLFSSVQARLHYVLQSESTLLQALFTGRRQLEPADADLLCQEYPGYSDCVRLALRERRLSVFFDPAEWKAFIAEKFAFAVGTRLHGTIIALNAGIPALVTNGDMRTKEVTGYLGIPSLPGICGLDFNLQTLTTRSILTG
jgi:hypothetical protein